MSEMRLLRRVCDALKKEGWSDWHIAAAVCIPDWRVRYRGIHHGTIVSTAYNVLTSRIGNAGLPVSLMMGAEGQGGAQGMAGWGGTPFVLPGAAAATPPGGSIVGSCGRDGGHPDASTNAGQGPTLEGIAVATAGNRNRVIDWEEAPPAGIRVGGRDNEEDDDGVPWAAVRRISVHDEDAREQVTEARMNGTPIVLTCHVGWAGFAARWLRKTNGSDTNPSREAQQMLDLSDPDWYLDVKAMADDIGSEEVGSNEQPTTLSIFLETSWPSNSGDFEGVADTTASPLQWQFTTSESGAAEKLCNQSQPLPNDILGEDLLSLWRESGENPYQYLFMGREDTMTELHKDPGGLAISIAPIIGEKECKLVHRSNENRRWKTVIKPGEILLMANGTWHACRNITPCLSYSRFHLDLLNIDAFLDSFFAEDAPEQKHYELLFNVTQEMIDRVDHIFDTGKIQQTKYKDMSLAMAVASLKILMCKVVQFRKRFQKHPIKACPYTINDWKKLESECEKCLLHVLV